jgi:hypothetical protein
VDVAGAEKLKEISSHQFEWWAVDLVNARPAKDYMKGADKGMDGYINFFDDKSGQSKKAIVQVRSGHIGVNHVRDLKGVLQREKAAIGALITLREPTQAHADGGRSSRLLRVEGISRPLSASANPHYRGTAGGQETRIPRPPRGNICQGREEDQVPTGGSLLAGRREPIVVRQHSGFHPEGKRCIDMTIPETWLEEANRRMGQEGTPYHQRPFRALEEWSEANNCTIVFGSELYEKVLAWFCRNSPLEAHHTGPQYEGAFYYDAYFWRVSIPIAYGSVELNPWDSLRDIPETVSARLRSDTGSALEFIALWADCMDYGFGRGDILASYPSSFGKTLFASANDHLDSTVALLRERRANPRAVESARFATEIFLKAFIALHRGLTEEQAKRRIGHDLSIALAGCLAILPSSELASLKPRIAEMPPVNSRYEAERRNPEDLWAAYGTAQFAGSAVVRSLTDRNTRAEVQEKLGRAPGRKA